MFKYPLSYLLHSLEDNVLCAFPQHQPAHLLEMLAPVNESEEVVPRQLADLAGEAGAPVREQDLGLAEATRVE